MAAQVVATRGEFAGKHDGEVRDLTLRAFQLRPELAGLVEQARSLNAQADATRANLRPQVSLNGGFIFLGAENFIPQGNGYVSLILDWTLTDSGRSRRTGRRAQRPGTSRGQAKGRPRRRRRPPGPDPLARPPAGQAKGARSPGSP